MSIRHNPKRSPKRKRRTISKPSKRGLNEGFNARVLNLLSSHIAHLSYECKTVKELRGKLTKIVTNDQLWNNLEQFTEAGASITRENFSLDW